MSFSADAVANEFLDLAASENIAISPMKLQKLVYYAHGWHLGLDEDKLIDEPIQAWRYGPVIQSLYREFKRFGSDPITEKALNARLSNKQVTFWTPSLAAENPSCEFQKSVIAKIWSLYKSYTGGQLSTMTHQAGTPWHTVVSAFPKGTFLEGVTIPNELIKEYFKSKIVA